MKYSIVGFFLGTTLGITLLGIGGLAYFWIKSDLERFEEDTQKNRLHYEKHYKNLSQQEVNKAIFLIESYQKVSLEKIQKHLIAQSAILVRTTKLILAQKNLSLTQKKAQIRQYLQNMQNWQGKIYVFAFSADGQIEVFPKPDMLGKSIYNNIFFNRKNLYKQFEQILAQEQKEGWLNGFWIKPAQLEHTFEQYSYAKYIPELDWFVGVVVYKNDIRKQLEEDMQTMLASLKSKDIVIQNFAGKYIYNPYFPIEGKSYANFKDQKGQNILERSRQAGKNGGSFETFYFRDAHDRANTKITFYKNLPELEWIVGSGFILEKIAYEIDQQEEKYRKKLHNKLISIVLVIMAILVTLLFLLYFMSQKLKAALAAVDALFVQAGLAAVGKFRYFQDFEKLAQTAQEMRLANEKAQNEIHELSKRLDHQNKAHEDANHQIAQQEATMREALDQLFEKHWLVNAIMEAIPYSLYIFDLENGKYIYANQEFEDFVGTTIAQIEHNYHEKGLKIFEELVHPDDMDVFLERRKKLLKNSKEICEAIFRMKNPKRGFHWVISRTKVLKSDIQGNIKQIIGVTIDIHEKMIAEEKIRKNERKYRSLIETTDTAYVIMDKNWRIVDANQQFVRLTANLDLDDILGKLIFKFLADNEIERVRLAKEIFEERHVLKNFEVNFKNNRGLATVEVNLSQVDEQIIALCWDTSFRKATEEKLKKQYQLLQDTNRVLDQFIYHASHALRTPISSILGLIHLLKIVPTEAEKYECLELLEKSVNQMKNRTTDIANYAYNSKNEIIYENIDFENFIQEVFREFNTSYPHHKLSLSYELLGNKNFYSDRGRLKIIFESILHNSSQFYDEQKEQKYAHICLQIETHELKIKISDNGIGIEKQYLDKIFDIFYKVHPESEGTGLGLFVVKETVEYLGGQIKVQSNLGQGTTFEIYLSKYKRK